MSPLRLTLLTALAMLAFAGNSLLCRLALRHTALDPATFTAVRLLAGAVMLAGLARLRPDRAGSGNWGSALALFIYAAGFSFAYVSLPAGTGALLLFGAVQATMIGHGWWRGGRPPARQLAGLALALGGLVGLLLPGWAAPAPDGAALMLTAGVAWGVYSLRGRGAGDPTRVTAGNFLRAAPCALVLSLATAGHALPDPRGLGWAVASGALASGVGYALWYAALPALRPGTAATVQLSVPLLAAAGAAGFLGEPLTWRLALAALAILGGLGLVIAAGANPAAAARR